MTTSFQCVFNVSNLMHFSQGVCYHRMKRETADIFATQNSHFRIIILKYRFGKLKSSRKNCNKNRKRVIFIFHLNNKQFFEKKK